MSHRNGEWVPGVDQVICPLPHRPGSPDVYWVKLRDRGSHAKSSHHKLGPEIPYEPPPPNSPDAFTLPAKCFDHEACAKAGGYGFRDESGVTFHRTKAKNWPKAKPEDKAKAIAEATAKDATATHDRTKDSPEKTQAA